jgi:RNA polymerase sigma-70 factor, ECF subfamily
MKNVFQALPAHSADQSNDSSNNFPHVTFHGFMDIVCMNDATIDFHTLYEQYAKEVYRFSFWLSGDSDDAKDITSETFVRVWTSTSEIRVESVKAYLFTIARNLYLQSKRKKGRSIRLEEEMRDTALQPDQAAEVRSELDEVMKALQTLSEIDRTVFIMRMEDELSYDEIARSTGLSVSAVKVKVFRARAKIHSLLNMQQGVTL